MDHTIPLIRTECEFLLLPPRPNNGNGRQVFLSVVVVHIFKNVRWWSNHKDNQKTYIRTNDGTDEFVWMPLMGQLVSGGWLADYGYRANKYPRHKFLAVGFMGCLPYQRLRRLPELKAIAGVSSHKHPYVQHSIYSYIYIVGKVCLYVRGYIWQRQATGAGAQPNRASTYCRLSILAWPVWRDHR